MEVNEMIKEFLLAAESKTYLAGEAGKIWKLDPADPNLYIKGETVYQYGVAATGEKPGLIYYDRYLGNSEFSGQEIIIAGGSPIWSRVYYGFVFIAVKDVMQFVRKARLNLLPVMWTRNQETYKDGYWRFTIEHQQPLVSVKLVQRFHYIEYASFDGRNCYRRICTGGVLYY